MTYFLLIIPALILAGLGWWMRRRYAFWGFLFMIIGCLAGLGALTWQVRQSHYQPSAKVPDRAYIAINFYLSNQAQGELAGKSGKVVLIFPPKSAMGDSVAENYANTFRAPFLRGHPEWDVQAARLSEPVRSSAIPLKAFTEVVTQFPDALAYISYAPVPADIQELFPAGPWRPFFVFDEAGNMNWLTALKQGQIRSVIVPRPGLDAATRAGVAGHPVEIFQQLYLMATPANADQVVAQLNTARR